jgi:hypothetical protein
VTLVAAERRLKLCLRKALLRQLKIFRRNFFYIRINKNKKIPKQLPGSLKIFNKITTYGTVNLLGEKESSLGSTDKSLSLNQTVRFYIPGKSHLNIHRRVCSLQLGIQVDPQSVSVIVVHPLFSYCIIHQQTPYNLSI